MEVTEPVGDTISGELQEWNGVYQGTGEQVSYHVTDATRCLITKLGEHRESICNWAPAQSSTTSSRGLRW